jgi:hypothetical protein
MTRATERPLARVLKGYQGVEYVVELTEQFITIRTKGSKRGGPVEKRITPSSLHDLLILRDARK